jgi:hypothetical protein
LVPTVGLRPADTNPANGQPAFGLYAQDLNRGRFYTVGLMVLTLSGARISAMTRYDPTTLPRFGLPTTLPDCGLLAAGAPAIAADRPQRGKSVEPRSARTARRTE